MRKIILSGLLFFAACKTSKFEYGTYRVATVKKSNGKSIVQLEGIRKEFVLPTDTLKKGDLIYFAAVPK